MFIRTIFAVTPNHNRLPYLIAFLFLVTLSDAPQRVNVEVLSSTAGGKVYLAAYDSADGFKNEDFISNASSPVNPAAASTELALRLPGTGNYVIAAFQDLNGNGELDRNLLGVPTEPYGFSKLPPSKWRAPSFGEVATRLAGSDSLTIEVRHWRDY